LMFNPHKLPMLCFLKTSKIVKREVGEA
jgi:hypothetical protein